MVTLGVTDIPQLINDGLYLSDGVLRVLHLHGNLEDPEHLVLDATSYARSAGNNDVRELFAALLTYSSLCILGSSFEEAYLATVLQARRPTTPRHVIVCDGPVADRILDGNSALTAHLHNVLVCDYPPREHAVLEGFCASWCAAQIHLRRVLRARRQVRPLSTPCISRDDYSTCTTCPGTARKWSRRRSHSAP